MEQNQNQYQSPNQYQYPPQPGAYQPQPYMYQPQPEMYQQPVADQMDYTPIGMWGYFGYQILFAIPIVGFVLLLVFSFGGTKNIHLRNFARSYFCIVLILLILAALGLIFSMLLAGSAFAYFL